MKNSNKLFSNSDIINIKKYNRLTKLEQASIILPNNLKDIIIGTSLGDLFIEKTSINGNARLIFRQSIIHKEYLEHLFYLFKNYTHREKLSKSSHNKKYVSFYYLKKKLTPYLVLPSYIV